MTDTASHFKEGVNALIFDELPYFGMILGVLCGGCRHSMIQRDR